MDLTLKDYQIDAVRGLLERILDARDMHQLPRPKDSSFALTATTGAGKTVIAAAVLEALLFGSDEFEFEADPSAVVIWFSDDPNLNEQTRRRLDEADGRLRYRTITVEAPFRVSSLDAGFIYMLNTQKLSSTSLLTRTGQTGVDDADALPGTGAPDRQPHTIWDIIATTIRDPQRTVYFVLDEAHRGFGARSDDQPTIVRRLVNGVDGGPAMPIVLGISATVSRFTAAMAEAEVSQSRISLPPVEVLASDVQESGLLKDDISVSFPKESGDFSTVLLGKATRALRDFSEAWATYAAAQDEPDVVQPLMVIQVPNTPAPADIKSAIDTMLGSWAELDESMIAHVFGDRRPQTYGPYVIPYISPEKVQDASHIRVLLAKDAISTGWDCPRAEVLLSFRPARDEDHITQLLGRMVRTPLARRIDGNELLSSVECILPSFDVRAAKAVVGKLIGINESFPGDGNRRRVLLNPALMQRNAEVAAEVWPLLEGVPTESLPRRSANPIKRLTALAHALAQDALRPGAGKEVHTWLNGVLDGLSARFASDLQAAMDEVLSMQVGTYVGSARYGTVDEQSTEEIADRRAVAAAYRGARRIVTPAVASAYLRHLAPTGDPDALDDAQVRVAGLAALAQTRDELESESKILADRWLDEYRVAMLGLSDARQAVYNDIAAMTTEPQRLQLTLPENSLEETERLVDDHTEMIPTLRMHLLSDALGDYPIGALRPGEVEVIQRELDRDDVVAWYRNPGRRSADSVSVAYQDGSLWRTMHPDFIVFSKHGDDYRTSIVDPHGAWLPDAAAKLRGLSRFAAKYGGSFHRIESISKVDGVLRVVDHLDASVRASTEACGNTSAAVDDLYRSSPAYS